MIENKRLNNMLTVREVSEILHVHTNTLRRWSDLGIVKAYRIGPRGDRRFKLEDIEQLLLNENKDMALNSNQVDRSGAKRQMSEYAM
jgi:excisionase family DNA binding protein